MSYKIKIIAHGIALSHTIELNKKKYYDALHQNSIRLDTTEWLIISVKWCFGPQNMVNFLIEKAAFYQRFETKLNERQQKVVARIFKEGIHGFQGGLSADNYRRITKTTASTATRDLQKLVELEAFIRTGERKGTRYYLNIDHPDSL